jgi:hypothetical protein
MAGGGDFTFPPTHPSVHDRTPSDLRATEAVAGDDRLIAGGRVARPLRRRPPAPLHLAGDRERSHAPSTRRASHTTEPIMPTATVGAVESGNSAVPIPSAPPIASRAPLA